MRQYYIDEISFLERDNLESYLKRTLKQGPMEGVFWLEVPPDLLAPIQQEHTDCGPFYISVLLEKDTLRAEFLVRSSHNMHCDCIAYATPAQRLFVLDFVDKMLEEEIIRA
jgi:protein involved in sex pheromone biosynthesis